MSGKDRNTLVSAYNNDSSRASREGGLEGRERPDTSDSPEPAGAEMREDDFNPDEIRGKESINDSMGTASPQPPEAQSQAGQICR